MNENRLNTDQAPVYPFPQEMQLTGRDFPLAGATIVAAGAEATRAASILGRWLADEYLLDLPVVHVAPASGRAIFIGGPDAAAGGIEPVDKPEGYSLAVGPDGARAVGHDYRGMLYAVATIMQLVQRGSEGLFLRGAAIRDWPWLPVRYVHVYVPGRDDIPFFKRYVRDFLLRYKFNGMVMEVGGGVRLEKRPEIATGWRRTVLEMFSYGDQGPKTGESCPLGPDRRFQDSTHPGIGGRGFIQPEDLRDLAAFAREHGQEVVPEIQALSHVYYLACPHRETAELPEALFPDAYCPSNEESYKVLFDVVDEYVEILRPPAVHIGHDEWRTAGLCPRCRQRHTGDMFAEDVIRIHKHLESKGIKTWMWGDHFLSMHNEKAHSGGKGGPVWYDHPSTEGAWKKVITACSDIVVMNWSWSICDKQGRQTDASDMELREKGFKFLYGNFYGNQFEGWPDRPERHQALGGAVSSWCRMSEFELGKMHVPIAMYSANQLWSRHCPGRAEATGLVMNMLPAIRDRLRGTHEPDIRIRQPAQVTIDLSGHFNAPLKTDRWDLSGLSQGEQCVNGLDCLLGNGAIIVRRVGQPETSGPAQVVIPVGRPLATLVFVQTSTGQGRRPMHAGDGTFFPLESSELIGIFDVVFEDGLVLNAQVRYEENVSAWDTGVKTILYHARSLVAGRLPDGSPLVVWGNEWANPRPDVPIIEVRFRGAGGTSQAQPILLGITGIEKVRFDNYRS